MHNPFEYKGPLDDFDGEESIDDFMMGIIRTNKLSRQFTNPITLLVRDIAEAIAPVLRTYDDVKCYAIGFLARNGFIERRVDPVRRAMYRAYVNVRYIGMPRTQKVPVKLDKVA